MKTIRPKPWPGQAPGLLFGRTTALLASPAPAGLQRGAVHSHFKVLMKAPSASMTRGGNTRSMELSAKPRVRHQMREGHNHTGHSAEAAAGGPAGTCVLSPYQSSRKEAEGGTQQAEAAVL